MSNFSLQEMLQRRILPAKPLQLAILRQIAAQLDEAHQRRLVHGNLTPQSILIAELEPEAGISVFVKGFGSRFDIDAGAMGGPAPFDAYYLSPEQVLGIDTGPQSDEFSFAAIAYELISGSRPFNASKLSGLIFAICSDTPKPVNELETSLSSGVAEVLSRALAKDREARYPTSGEFAAALENELVLCEGWSRNETASDTLAVAAGAAAVSPPASGREPIAAAELPSAVVELPAPPPPVIPPEQPPPVQAQAEPAFRPAPPFIPVEKSPPPPPAWNAKPSFEPPAGPVRPEFEFPPVRRRQHYEEDQPTLTASPVRKFALAGLVLFLLAGVAAFFFSGSAKSDLPSQVLDTKNAPVSPPPAKDEPSSAQAQLPASAPSSTSTAASHPVPAPATSQTVPAASQRAPAASSQSAPVTKPVPAPLRTAKTGAVTTGRFSGGLVDVELLSEPPGASVLVDSNPALACRAPCNISLTEGRHTLSASLAGYTVAQRIFNVPETTSVFVAMPRLTGALVVTSNPGAATILVDGKDYGLTPATLHLPPGPHRITLMNGSQRHDEVVSVVAAGIQATGYSFPR